MGLRPAIAVTCMRLYAIADRARARAPLMGTTNPQTRLDTVPSDLGLLACCGMAVRVHVCANYNLCHVELDVIGGRARCPARSCFHLDFAC